MSPNNDGMSLTSATIVAAIVGACITGAFTIAATILGVRLGKVEINPNGITDISSQAVDMTQTPWLITTTPQPVTSLRAPTSQANVTVAPRGPIVVTATPSSDQQDPAPGSLIDAGLGYKKNNIAISSGKTLWIDSRRIGFSIRIENRGSQQLVVLWQNSFIHLRDNKGKIFRQTNEGRSDWNQTKQFTISGASSQSIESNFYDYPNEADIFVGVLDIGTKYLVLTVDQIAGMTNMNWRYDLQ